MRRFPLSTVAPLFVATLVALSTGTPASATATDRGAPAPVVRTAMDGSTVCVRRVDSQRCGAYQEALLRAVETRVTTTTSRPISVNDVSHRQLDALIASVN